jgi:fatty acid desaturase
MQANLAGRLLLGPIDVVLRFLAAEVRRAMRQPRTVAADWAPHLIGVALLLVWLSICHIGIGFYTVAMVYPGISLTLLRSFAEHRAARESLHRVAVVERAGPLALLFLNNNLHAAHHRAPGIAWYRLPAFYRCHRDTILAENGGLLYRGYGEIVRRYWRRSHDVIFHPDWQT